VRHPARWVGTHYPPDARKIEVPCDGVKEVAAVRGARLTDGEARTSVTTVDSVDTASDRRQKMLGFGRRKKTDGGAFRFRVSDVVDVPLRGIMLRLRVLDGKPDLGDLAVGRELLLNSPGGEERRVVIAAHSVTGGKPTQARLDRTREFDVIVQPMGAAAEPVEIGWTAAGPVSSDERTA
jgi:hypothetical protein